MLLTGHLLRVEVHVPVGETIIVLKPEFLEISGALTPVTAALDWQSKVGRSCFFTMAKKVVVASVSPTTPCRSPRDFAPDGSDAPLFRLVRIWLAIPGEIERAACL